MDKVSIVIPVYGQWDLVKRNIDALLKYETDNIAEILVVDDFSPEPNPFIFDKVVRIIKNEKNKGYTGTVNNGLKAAKSEIIILLDSDAYPIGKFIKQLLMIYAPDPAIGCIGFRTVDDNGKNTGNYQYEPSIWGLIAGQLLEAKFGFLRFWRNRNILPYSCAVSFSKSCLNELDYFDELNFPVLEADNDISMRVHRSKWKLLFANDIVICHKGGNSYKVNYKRVLLFHKSRWALLRKHKMIMLPLIAKALIALRVNIELFVFYCFSRNENRIEKYAEKIKGRKILKKEIVWYK